MLQEAREKSEQNGQEVEWEWRREEDRASQGPNRKQTEYSHEDDLQRVLSQRAGPMAVGGEMQELRARGSRAITIPRLTGMRGEVIRRRWSHRLP